MKKTTTIVILLILTISLVIGCGSKSGEKGFDNTSEIVVVTREDGSGTRGAFVELTGVEEKGEGTRIDRTTKEAITQMKTATVLTTVAGNKHSIGYVSTGSLNDTVKVLNIDGVEPTSENIKAGKYKISRPFNIATKGEIGELAQDFIDFIMSKEGQEVVAESYISVDDNATSYNGTKPSGKIVVAGSSSVAPVMEKLREAYIEINTNATIEVQQSDSTAGIQAAIEGTTDIGMASRELTDSEKSELTDLAIALDGIAIIVNPSNPINDLSVEDVKSIYIGETIKWNQITE